ncbi:MAG: hypothetical protein JW763_06140 [candidate division Zixibacteria bacterium]|nr:hypothetical protein [candidate division Zixibacteria bacterium]
MARHAVIYGLVFITLFIPNIFGQSNRFDPESDVPPPVGYDRFVRNKKNPKHEVPLEHTKTATLLLGQDRGELVYSLMVHNERYRYEITTPDDSTLIVTVDDCASWNCGDRVETQNVTLPTMEENQTVT